MDLKLKGKLALVSGSTAGIGFAIATRLAEEGARVIVNGRTQPAVDKVVAELTAAIPSGSFLVITHVAGDMGRMTPGAMEAARRLSELLPQRVNPRSQAQVTKFFDGLELVEPGVVPIQQWRPESDEEAAAPAALWGGVARKP